MPSTEYVIDGHELRLEGKRYGGARPGYVDVSAPLMYSPRCSASELEDAQRTWRQHLAEAEFPPSTSTDVSAAPRAPCTAPVALSSKYSSICKGSNRLNLSNAFAIDMDELDSELDAIKGDQRKVSPSVPSTVSVVSVLDFEKGMLERDDETEESPIPAINLLDIGFISNDETGDLKPSPLHLPRQLELVDHKDDELLSDWPECRPEFDVRSLPCSPPENSKDFKCHDGAPELMWGLCFQRSEKLSATCSWLRPCRCWDFSVALLALADCVLAPLHVAFSRCDEKIDRQRNFWLLWLSWPIDVLLLLDFIFKLCIGRRSSSSSIQDETSSELGSGSYCRPFWSLLLYAVASIPWCFCATFVATPCCQTSFDSCGSHPLRLFSFLRIAWPIRYCNMISQGCERRSSYITTMHVVRVCGLFVLLLLACHWISCLLLIITQPEHWHSNLSEYADSFFITIFLVLGMIPSQESQAYEAFMNHQKSEAHWIIALAMTVGVALLISLASTVAAAVSHVIDDSSEIRWQAQQVRSFLQDAQAPECLYQDIQRWLDIREQQIAKDLQHCSGDSELGEGMVFCDRDAIQRRLLHVSSLLCQLDITSPGFALSLACLVQCEVVIKGDCFFLEGEVGTHIYFIEEGLVQLRDSSCEPVACTWARLQPEWPSTVPAGFSSVAEGVPLDKDVVVLSPNEHGLGPGSIIGDIALLCGCLQPSSAVATRDCIAWALAKQDACNLLQGFPKAAQHWHATVSQD